MKKLIVAILACSFLFSCGPKPEKKVMARYVPERMDDFVWENNLVCYRAYGQALEGNPTSPGFDIWVKLPGKLVANDWYREALSDGAYYHHDHGGKDCYKVAVSLGGGASSPLVDGALVYPATNYRSWEILSESDTEISFVLTYPAWEVAGAQVSLAKKITVSADSYLCRVDDVYSGDFDSLTIAAGLFTHNAEGLEATLVEADRLAIWEHASDQSLESEDGMLGVAVVLPGAESILALDGEKPHLVATKTVRPGETLTYWFGSCWSKGDIKTAEDWFNLIKNF